MKEMQGIFVYRSILNQSDMTPSKALLLCQLIFLSKNKDDFYCNPSLSYLSKLINVSKRTILSMLEQLVKEGYISKEANYFEGTNGNKTNKYHLTNKTICLLPSEETSPPSEEITQDLVKKLHQPGEETSPINNNKKDIKKNTTNEIQKNIPYQEVIDMYNSICVRLPKVRKLTDEKKKYIKARYEENENDIDIFKEVFEKANASDFLCGENENNYKYGFNWIMKNQNNFIKVLEDTYINRNSKKIDSSDSIAEKPNHDLVAEKLKKRMEKINNE